MMKMNRPKYETCRHVGSVGALAVYVKPSCPRANWTKGVMVSSRKRCEECGCWRGKVAIVNNDFERAVEEMVQNDKN